MIRSIKRIIIFSLVIFLSSMPIGSASPTDGPILLSVIDLVLSWNTFLGSTSDESGRGMAVDGSGNIYVTGYSYASWGTPINPHIGSSDAFVAKLNSSGVLQWNTFLGSSSVDSGQAISLDGSGNVYVVGYSTANWGSPVNAYAGGTDVFVAKLNSSGDLQWSTFMGSSNHEYSYAIEDSGSGAVYVVGQSSSTWGTPINAYTGSTDAFAAELNSSGVLQWNTFMGSSLTDSGRGIAVDGMGDIYVIGGSGATWGTPINAHAGSSDVFAAKLDSDGILQWNTFLGCSSSDSGSGISVDSDKNVYIAGTSNATWGTPVNPHAGDYESFVAKLNSSGILQWNTFMGCSSYDNANGIIVNDSGDLHVVGDSNISWGTPHNPHSGYDDVFVARLNNSGSLQWNTFMGSTHWDYGNAIAEDGSGNIYVVGDSHETWGTPINAHAGGDDVFVANIYEEPEINVRMGGVNFADGSTRNLGTRPSSLIMGRDFTFRVENLGSAPLNLTGMPEVTLSGSHGSHFQVTQQPTSPVEPYGSSTFKIRTVRDSLPGFLPVGWEYSVSFTVNIPNDDTDENPYDFTINFTLKKD